MDKITRRTFIKASGTVAAGTYVGYKLGLPVLSDLGLIEDASAQGLAPVEDYVHTTCWIGKQDCGMLARRMDGRVVSLQGHPDHPRNEGTLCPKGVGQIQALYDPNRIKTPLIRTNGKGQSGEFREASWDEALTLVAGKMNEARAKGKGHFVWQKGRSKAKPFYDKAFVNASSALKLHHGAYCSDSGYRALEYTVGPHAVLSPDIKHTNYLLSWGWNITNGGGNKLCWLTWPRYLNDARERGMKVVTIDPRLRGAGPHTDEWVAIKPGTDLAMVLALMNRVIAQGTIDTEYLTKYTNSPYLVKADGSILRVGDKEQVWDSALGGPAAFDAAASPALEGTFTVDGQSVTTGFTLFKEHLQQYTPQWAESICDIKADVITRIAKELGEEARIGSTIEIDGKQLPYRPVGIMAYHVAQQELGFQAIRGMVMLMMLLGSIGTVGGQHSDFGWKVDSKYSKLDAISVKDGPYNLYLDKSKFYPINSNNSSVVAKAMQDPEKYELDVMPEVVLLHHVNPLGSFASQKDIKASYDRFKFVAVIDPWLSLTADLYADVVLPAATMEKYEGPLGVKDPYNDAVSLRVPVMEPMFQSKGDIDIYIDLCEKAGLLYGEGGYLDEVNSQLKIKDGYKLALDRKPTTREIFDQWAKSEGIEDGVEYFEKHGVKLKGPFSATKLYGTAQDPKYGGAVHRLYGESLLRMQNEMKSKGSGEIYWQDYTAFPTWRTPTMFGSPSEYDLTLISYKLIEFKQSRTPIPSLLEMAPHQLIEINPATAKAKGIKDGDEVWVESHNALTGETRRVKTIASLRESIRPDTAGMPHHYGEIAKHPSVKGQGPTANELYFTGEGYTTCTADQSFHVQVKITKAGGA